MTHRLKAVGLAALALLALTAVLASAAQANVKVTSPSYPVTLAGEQTNENIFKVGPSGTRSVTCKSGLFAGTLTAASESVEVEPTYSNCTGSPGSLLATITPNGCKYQVVSTSAALEEGSTAKAHIKVVCPTGKEIEVHLFENETKDKENKSLCTYGIGSQGPITGTVVLHNIATTTVPLHLRMTVNLKEIVTKVISGTKILCGAAAGENTTATYEGPSGAAAEITILGKKENKEVELMVG